MTAPEVFIKNEIKEWQNVANGIKRKIMAFDENLMLVKVEFEKGSIGALHQHYHHQITHIERGVFEVVIDDKKQILETGDAFYIPAHTLHGCVCLEDGVLIDVFSPMREDFINNF